MELKNLFIKNRSYRGFDSSCKIDRKILEEFVDNVRYTPSSVNLQPLKFFISNTEESNRKILPLLGWAKKLKITLPKKGEEPTAFIVICHDKNISENESAFQKDVGIAAMTIMLSAVEKELGGCMIGNFSPEKISEALGFPENIKPQLVLALGKPTDNIVTEPVKDGNTDYYRDENDVHHVPKRSLEEIIFN